MSASTSAEPQPARRYVFLALKIAVSIILLTILLSRIDVGQLWGTLRRASFVWLAVALGIYFVNVVASSWRWRTLLAAQDVHMPLSTLIKSFMVALYFNNFLPSNIGGDFIRVKDTARAAGSKTMATIVILADRVIGLIALVLVAALGATMVAEIGGHVASPIWPSWLWAGFIGGAIAFAPAVLAPAGVGRLLQPLTVLHPEWVGSRIDNLTSTLARFREHPVAILSCFAGAVFVQSTIVVFYIAVAHALHIPVQGWDLAVIVPLSFIVQMLPVSLNGFGVREATFTFYFTRVGLPIESALLTSLIAQALIMLFSVSGAAIWFSRGHQ